MIVEIEELEKLDASETYPRRENAKEVLISEPKKMKFCISCCRWFSKIIRKRLRIPRTHSEADRKERVSVENLMVFLGSTQKLGKNFIYRHHIEPRSSTNVPREESILMYKICLYNWTKLLREEIYDAGVEMEKPKHLRQKTNSIFFGVARKGRNSVLYYNFTRTSRNPELRTVQKILEICLSETHASGNWEAQIKDLSTQAMLIPDAKATMEKEWKEGIKKAHKKTRKIHFVALMDIRHKHRFEYIPENVRKNNLKCGNYQAQMRELYTNFQKKSIKQGWG